MKPTNPQPSEKPQNDEQAAQGLGQLKGAPTRMPEATDQQPTHIDESSRANTPPKGSERYHTFPDVVPPELAQQPTTNDRLKTLRYKLGIALKGNYPGSTATTQFLDDCMMFIEAHLTRLLVLERIAEWKLAKPHLTDDLVAYSITSRLEDNRGSVVWCENLEEYIDDRIKVLESQLERTNAITAQVKEEV